MQNYNRKLLKSPNNYDAMYTTVFKHNVRKNLVRYNEVEELISCTLCSYVVQKRVRTLDI